RPGRHGARAVEHRALGSRPDRHGGHPPSPPQMKTLSPPARGALGEPGEAGGGGGANCTAPTAGGTKKTQGQKHPWAFVLTIHYLSAGTNRIATSVSPRFFSALMLSGLSDASSFPSFDNVTRPIFEITYGQ